jgi:DNA repair protein RadA/Sms
LFEVASASTRAVGRATRGESGGASSRIQGADEVSAEALAAHPTGLKELDRVLGGGVVPGSVVLIGGDPGIGKSTLLLQALVGLGASGIAPALYVTGEESLSQVIARARRLSLAPEHLRLLAETRVERVIELSAAERPRAIVIDSIQTMHTDLVQSAPGSVAQVRECAAQLLRYAKETGAGLFLVGHVTKEGALAGPRVLEHMVDTVLYFESEQGSRYRVIRAVKNRFGAANELGLFAMTERGLRPVGNPSAIFLSRREVEVPGSAVMVTREGTRPLLVEVQALVDDSQLPSPRRITVGLDPNRLAMLLAVMHRHAGLSTHGQDVFVNVAGGVRITETGADLAVVVAVSSSYRSRAVANDVVVFGEVGLSGEVRPVPNGEDRLREALKHGFKRAVIPKANLPRRPIGTIEAVGVDDLAGALESF